MDYFFVFSADGSNKLVTVWVNAPEKSYWVLPENGLVNIGYRVILYRKLRVEIFKNLLNQQKIPKPCICNDWHLANGSSEPNYSLHFLI